MSLSAAASRSRRALCLVQWRWPIVIAGRHCETSKVLRRPSSEIRYRGCRRSISGDAKSGVIEPEAGDRSKFSLFAARAHTNSAGACRRRSRRLAAFPRSNGFDYDFDPGQCTLDFTLHALNLSVQKSLQFLEFVR